MTILQTKLFARQKKKLHANQINDLDYAITNISKNPIVGEQKKGDLSWIRIYKFKIKSQESLLAYRVIQDFIELLSLGSHENFYRNLKRLINQ